MKKRGILALAIYMLIFILVLVAVLAARSIIVEAINYAEPDAEAATNAITSVLIALCVICFIPLFFKLLHVFTGLKAFGFLCMLIDCYIIYTGVTILISDINYGYDLTGTIVEIAFFVVALISNAVSVFRRSE